MAEKATVIVGLKNISPDARALVIDSVAHYSKQNPHLEVPNPYDIFESTINVGMVSWEEHKAFSRYANTWPRILGSAVRIDELAVTTPDFSQQAQQDLSLDRPVQGELF